MSRLEQQRGSRTASCPLPTSAGVDPPAHAAAYWLYPLPPSYYTESKVSSHHQQEPTCVPGLGIQALDSCCCCCYCRGADVAVSVCMVLLSLLGCCICCSCRIMKKALPGNAKIAKDAKDAIQECVSEFIGFITSE